MAVHQLAEQIRPFGSLARNLVSPARRIRNSRSEAEWARSAGISILIL